MRLFRLPALPQPKQGPLTPSALAEHFQLDRALTSRMIGSLVKKGLIVRQATPDNRRHALVEITAGGSNLYDKLMPQVEEINRRVLQVLSPSEMALLDEIIARLHHSAEQLRREMKEELPKTQRRLGRRRV